MKKLMLVSIALIVWVPFVLAQYQQDKSANQTKTITGCLQKGDEPNEFAITGEGGKTWKLRSSTVKLADHVGHTGTVSGTVTREAKGEERKEGEVAKAAGKEQYGEVRVTDLKMVSQSCTK